MEADFDRYEDRRSRGGKGRKKILEKGCTKPITKQRTPVAKIIYRVKNKLAASSSSGVILSSIGFFFHPLDDYPRNSVGFVHAAASIN